MITVLLNVEPQPPGALAAHAVSLLTLLPSGPDVVREAPLRKTRALRLDLQKERRLFYHSRARRVNKNMNAVCELFDYDLCKST